MELQNLSLNASNLIQVHGDNMYPKLSAGNLISIKPVEFEYLVYGHPYVITFQNGDTYIKYIKKGKDENHLKLEDHNKFYEPKEFHIDLIKCYYTIIGVVKKEMM